MKLISVYFLKCFLWTKILGTSSTSNYYDGLIKYLKKESKLHQVVFIRPEVNDIDPVMNSLMKAVNKNFPSLSISFDAIKSESETKYLNLFYKSRRKILFVLHFGSINAQMLRSKFIRLSKRNAHLTSFPRCLIINSYLSKPEYLNKTLHSFWQKKYLDITLLSHNQQHQVLLLLNTNHTNKVLHLSKVNLFTNKFFFENVSLESQWFPNKLRDLNGHKLNFLSFNISPVSNERSIKLANLLAHAMNCKYVIRRQRNTAGTVLDFIPQNNDLILETVKIILSPENLTPDEKYSLRLLLIGSFRFVIPNILKYSNNMILSREFWYMFLATISTIVILRLVTFLMRFKKNVWEILNISQIIMGMSTCREPNNSLERMLFGPLLIACIVYSGYFYSVILDIAWRTEPAISNLTELADSTLTPMMPWDQKSLLLNGSDVSYLKTLGKRAIKSLGDGLHSNCWRYLIDYQNVSCLFSNAEYFVNEKEAKNNLNVKILAEAATHFAYTWTTGMNSPYQDRINEILLRASEFGFLEYLYPSKVKVNNILPLETIHKEKLLFVLFYVLTIGYSLSIIVFLLEIFTAKFGHRIYTFYMRFRFAN